VANQYPYLAPLFYTPSYVSGLFCFFCPRALGVRKKRGQLPRIGQQRSIVAVCQGKRRSTSASTLLLDAKKGGGVSIFRDCNRPPPSLP